VRNRKKLGGKASGRGNRRRLRQQRRSGVEITSQSEINGRIENKCRGLRGKFQFSELYLEARRFFGLSALGNLFAQRAGVVSIEGFGDGFLERVSLDVFRQHPGPGHGLQHGPMPARRAEQRNNQQPMSHSCQHSFVIVECGGNVKRDASQGEQTEFGLRIL
jgi:hypothetical protein